MYGPTSGKVKCFTASSKGEINECTVDAITLDECTLKICKGEGAYTIIPIYNGGFIASRWSEHLHRLNESCELLSIPHASVFTSSTNNDEPLAK